MRLRRVFEVAGIKESRERKMSKEVTIIGLDPGPERSAFAALTDGKLGAHGWLPNEEVLFYVTTTQFQHLAIETLHPRAEPVSLLAMQAQLWAGRFIEAAGVSFTCIDERDARFEATGNPSATNKDVRHGLLNIFGEDHQEACQCDSGKVPGKREGTMKICPACKGERFVTVRGPLADYNEHERSALAAAYRVWKRKFEVPAASAAFGTTGPFSSPTATAAGGSM